MIGGRCTGGNVLSRAVLITRKLSWREPRAGPPVWAAVRRANKDTGMQDVKPDEYGWARSIEVAEGFVARSVPPMVFFKIRQPARKPMRAAG